MATGPIKSAFCSLCCRTHFRDVDCDPTDKRYTANARAMAMADAIEERAHPAPLEYKPATPAPEIARRPGGFSYAEETAWNDPWWTA